MQALRRRTLRVPDDRATTFEFETTLLVEPNTRRKCDLLFFKHAMGQNVGGVIFKDGTSALQDHRAAVVGIIDEVDGATADLATIINDGLMHLPAIHSLAAEAG